MFQITSYETLSPQADKNKKNQNALSSGGSRGIGRDIKNLLTVAKSANSKSWILQKLNLLEQIFLLLKLKRSLYTYKKFLPRLQFLGILIQNAIFVSKLMLWGMSLAESFIK